MFPTRNLLLFYLVATLCSVSTAALPSACVAQSTTHLQSAPSPVDNPLKGLVPYARPTPDRFPHSMEFSYIPLSDLVKGPNQYDFDKLEELLEDVASRGNQTIFRIMLEYPGKTGLIPAYLIDDGLKIHKYLNTNTAPFPPKQIETPDYEDLNLRQCMSDFIAELGSKYDGDPRIAYITAGLLGTWGEWHTFPKNDLWASKKVQHEVLVAYRKAFQKTPILLRYPASKGDQLYTPTGDLPFGYHDDSFAYATKFSDQPDEDWFFLEKLKAADALETWKKHPIGGEIRPELWGCCFDSNPCLERGQTFGKCRDATHVTWLMDTGMFREKADQQRYANAVSEVRKMGYDFVVHSVTVDTAPQDRKRTSAAFRLKVGVLGIGEINDSYGNTRRLP